MVAMPNVIERVDAKVQAASFDDWAGWLAAAAPPAHAAALAGSGSHSTSSAPAGRTSSTPRRAASPAAALVAATTVQHELGREIEPSARVDGAAALSC